MNLRNRFLKSGDAGDDVCELQRDLIAVSALYQLEALAEETAHCRFGARTRAAVVAYQEANRARILALRNVSGEFWSKGLGIVDTATALALTEDAARQPPTPRVTGIVRTADGQPVAGLHVHAYDRDLRKSEPLGKPAKSGADGRFTIAYSTADYAAGEAVTADIGVEITGEHGRTVIVVQVARLVNGAAQPVDAPFVVFNAPTLLDLAITVELPKRKGDDEFTRLTRVLTPVIRDIAVVDLDDKDLAFLTAEFAAVQPWITRDKLDLLLASHQRSRDAAQQRHEVPPAAFYGLGREGLALDLPSLAVVPAAELRRRLDLAIADWIIPRESHASLDSTVHSIVSLARIQLLAQPETNLGSLLTGAGLNQDQQLRLLEAFAGNDDPAGDVWAKIRQDPAFGAGQVDRAQLALQVNALSKANADLANAVAGLVPGAANLRDLYRGLDAEKLYNVVLQHGAPGGTAGDTPEQRSRQFAADVLSLLTAAFPTDAVARLMPTLPAGHLGGANVQHAVVQFFQKAPPDFDLATVRIDDHSSLITGLADIDRTTALNHLKRVQRVFRLSVDSQTLTGLLGSGLDSAHEIVKIPPASFEARFATALGGVDNAKLVYDRALTVHSASALLYSRLFDAINGVHVRAGFHQPADIQKVVLNDFPDLAELFGAQELCECGECLSIFSPASYFVELLDFLGNSTPNPGGVTPLGVLVGGRRPDLPFIPLTCENTNTRLPYIDLVNEILEAYVAFGKLDATTAKDTGNATEAELSANPQYFIEQAYQTLKGAIFPLTLPYDQALDVLRVYWNNLGTSRYDLLRAFDQRDGTLPPLSQQAAEYLGMTPVEFEVITGTDFGGATTKIYTTFGQPWGLGDKELSPPLAPGAQGIAVKALQLKLNAFGSPPLILTGVLDAPTEAALKAFQSFYGLPATGVPDTATWALLNALDPDIVEVFLSSVPELLQRAGIAYTDLVELLKTQFVNPGFPRLQFLEDHHITYADMDDLSKSGFVTPNANITEALLDPDIGMTTAEFLAWAKARFTALGQLIVLQSPGAACDLTNTIVSRLNGKPVGGNTWLRINQFLRLWKRLGWSIRDIDRALLGLHSANIDIAAIVSLRVTLRLMRTLKLPVAPVLSFWFGIDTQGPDSLYDRLFLSRAMQKLDNSFALNPERTELRKTDALDSHVPAVLAALRLNEADLDALRDALGLPGAAAMMNRATLSLLYRHTALASALGLSIQDFLKLKSLISFDPFLVSEFGPSNTELFLDAALKVKESKFGVGELSYLYLDSAAPGIRPTDATVQQLLQRLRGGLAAIVTEYGMAPDPDGTRTRAALGELFEPQIVEQAARMLDGSAVYLAALTGLPASFAFPASLAGRMEYQPDPGVLRFQGAMTATERIALKTLSAPLAAPLKTAYEVAIDAIYQQPRDLITIALASGGVFLTLADAEAHILQTATVDDSGRPLWLDADGNVVTLDATGNPVPPGAPPSVITAVEARFDYLLLQLLPFVKAQRSKRLIVETLGAVLQLTADQIDVLLSNAGVLHLPVAAATPLLDHFTALAGDGLLGTYFNSPGLVGATQTRVDETISFHWGMGDTVPGGAKSPFSIRWTGNLLADRSETFTFAFRTAGGVRLLVGPTTVLDTFAAPAPPEVRGSITLTAGAVYPVTIEYTNSVFEGVLEWYWTSPSVARNRVPTALLYSTATGASLENPTNGYHLLNKVAVLVNHFALAAPEILYLATHAADFANLDLSAFPLAPVASNAVLFTAWLRLFDYVASRNELPQYGDGGPALIDVFAAAAASAVPGALGAATVAAYQALTGIDLTAAANALGFTDSSLRNEIALARIQTILDLSQLTGVETGQLSEWSSKAPDSGPATDIKRIVKARYDEDAWPGVARPLNDKLRDDQRDALVAYLLPRLQLANANELYEYLLIDVQMETCMDTSRIIQAIAAVQQFIQRCLLGLEPDVARGAIDNRRWQVLRSFRVWEAERRVFVHTENWLEPELRQDKSIFFQELENDLLQTDLTPYAVENAFLNYLYKLDEVARLDLVGMYLEGKAEGDGENDVIHLFGRTPHRPHVYYYRRRVNNAQWTPWERIQLDFDAVENGPDSGVHLMPVVWNRRLFLFWPQFTELTDDRTDLTRTESAAHKQWQKDHDAWQKAYAAWQQAYAQWEQNLRDWERVHNVDGVAEFYPIFPPVAPKEPKEPEDDTALQRPPKNLDISIAWTQYAPDGTWSPKQTTPLSVRSTNLDRKQYVFQAVPLYDGTLSVSFYSRHISDVHYTHDPLHPQLVQQIIVEDNGVDTGQFLFTGCRGDIETAGSYMAPTSGRLWTVLPDNSRVDYLRFEKWPQGSKPGLTLDVGDYLSLNIHVVGSSIVAARRTPLPLLTATPPISKIDARQNRFHLLYPHEIPLFTGQVAFCYGDDLRDYLVTPVSIVSGMLRPDAVSVLPARRTLASLAATVAAPRMAVDPALAAMEWVKASYLEQPWASSTMSLASAYLGGYQRHLYLFENLFHPYACAFVRSLKRGGVDALLATGNQRLSDIQPAGGGAFTNNFEQLYKPTVSVALPTPPEIVDFSLSGSYSSYNWELFFHAVMLVAVNLNRNQRYGDAMKWYRYVFDPTSTSPEPVPARYWNFLPFKTAEPDNVAELMLLESTPDAKLTPAQQEEKANFAAQWTAFKQNPFMPHVIARLRPVAYQKNVVMKYVQNLLDWGDSLFRQDTRETITEATQLYVLASELLGPRPQRVPRLGRVATETYDSLKKKQAAGKLDPFSNGLVALEQEFPFSAGVPGGGGGGGAAPPAITDTLYFCIPFNDQMLALWDTVEDRLFKIRNCMNIDGIVRALPLVAPPIDPGLLVQAAAGGIDIATALNDLNTPMSQYRFAVLLPKAIEFTNEVKSLGAAFLAALEKRDVETISNLRAQHESNLLNLVREVKAQQLTEVRTNRIALDRSRDVVSSRYQYFSSRQDRNASEANQLVELGISETLQYDSQSAEQSASMIATYLPDVATGFSGLGPHFTATLGRGNLIAYYQANSREKAFEASQHTQAASLATTIGSWLRRRDDWNYQAEQAAKELLQIEQQIAAADIRTDICNKELLNHDRQIRDADVVEAFLRDKFTNADLYNFECQQIARLFFQTYQMAYELARKAERAYRFELGLTTSDFVQFGYWEDMRKGLLSGERLAVALRQMERSFQDLNRREYEIARHVSLLLHDPEALMQLKQTGSCEVELPEAFFDADYPGHYMRRLKTVSLTIPAVVGPYTSVNCTLTLLANKTRIVPIVGDGYAERLDSSDDRFVSNFIALQSVATSSGQNDTGLFELNFRDDRYLPFEAAGAISRWRIDLPQEDNAFDLDTISDLILHVRYTAREGGNVLRKAARSNLKDLAAAGGPNQVRLFSLRHEYPNDWYRFITPVDATATRQSLTLELPIERFPYRFRGAQVQITDVELLMPLKNFTDDSGTTIYALNDYRPKPLNVTISFQNAGGATTASVSAKLTSTGILDGTPYLHWGHPALGPQGIPSHFVLEVQEADVLLLAPTLRQQVPPLTGKYRIKPEMLEDIIVLLHFTATTS